MRFKLFSRSTAPTASSPSDRLSPLVDANTLSTLDLVNAIHRLLAGGRQPEPVPKKRVNGGHFHEEGG
jgi:hypothetical protein